MVRLQATANAKGPVITITTASMKQRYQAMAVFENTELPGGGGQHLLAKRVAPEHILEADAPLKAVLRAADEVQQHPPGGYQVSWSERVIAMPNGEPVAHVQWLATNKVVIEAVASLQTDRFCSLVPQI